MSLLISRLTVPLFVLIAALSAVACGGGVIADGELVLQTVDATGADSGAPLGYRFDAGSVSPERGLSAVCLAGGGATYLVTVNAPDVANDDDVQTVRLGCR